MNKNNFEFSYILDSNGPKGIAIESWLNKRKSGLILVDYQNYWLDENYGSESEIVWRTESTKSYVFNRYRKTVLPNSLSLIKKFRDLNLKIIFLRNGSKNKKLLDIKGLSRKIYAYELKDSKGQSYHMYDDEYASQIVDELKPHDEDIVIIKTSIGAFNSSDIDGILRADGIESLVFAGGYTDGCLESAVRAAFDRGYLCTVAEDACISNIEEDHQASLRIMDKYFAWVTNTDNIITNL